VCMLCVRERNTETDMDGCLISVVVENIPLLSLTTDRAGSRKNIVKGGERCYSVD